jgi:hypothetical protein
MSVYCTPVTILRASIQNISTSVVRRRTRLTAVIVADMGCGGSLQRLTASTATSTQRRTRTGPRQVGRVSRVDGFVQGVSSHRKYKLEVPVPNQPAGWLHLLRQRLTGRCTGADTRSLRHRPSQPFAAEDSRWPEDHREPGQARCHQAGQGRDWEHEVSYVL